MALPKNRSYFGVFSYSLFLTFIYIEKAKTYSYLLRVQHVYGDFFSGSKWNFSSQNTGSFHGASKLGDSNESIMVQILLQKIEGDPETTSMEKTIQQIQSCINNHNRLSSSRTPKLKFHLESDDGFEIQSNSLLS